LQELPPGPEALDAILRVRPCEDPYPSWIGLQDRRDLRDPEAQYAVHRRLVATAAAAGALRVALARAAAAFLARESWKRLGFARLSDYAEERLGVSSRELQELARVGAKLDRLPALEAALAAGRIGFSKARLIASVASASEEGRWIERAQRLSTRALAEEMREATTEDGMARAPALDDPPPRRFFQLACSARARGQWHRVRELARRVAGGPVSAAQCIDMLTAEVRSAIGVDPDAPDAAPERRGSSWSEAVGASRPPWDPPPPSYFGECAQRESAGLSPSLARALRKLVDGLEHAKPWELERRLRAWLRREQRLDSQLGALLCIVEERWVFRAYQCPSASRYAEEWLGLSQRKAQMLLRIERAVRHCPALARAYRSGRLSWVRADALVPLVFADPAGRFLDRWVSRARRLTVRQLRDEVEHALLILETDPKRWARTGGLASSVDGQADADGVDAKTCASSTIGFSAEPECIAAFWATLWTVRRRIERVSGALPTEGEALEVMMDHVLREWGGDAEVRKTHRIMARDGWRCLVPACSSRRNLHVHHVVPRSRGGGDEDSNLVTLCAWHHLRGVHGGIVEITGKAPDALLFQLGVRPDGPPLAVYRSGDVIVETR
jgi:hypothetical protein